MRRILVLGAGLVAGPLVRYLLDQPGYRVTLASRTRSRAEALVGGHPQGAVTAFDVSRDGDELSSLVAGADLVVSLLPYIHHLGVATECVRQGRHLVTTSYVSDGMRALDEPASEAGVILLNEIGLDPGIDHMSAMHTISRIHSDGGKVRSFRSYCGGLPAPRANNNPLGYKFSWSPRGVLLAGRNHAQFTERGAVVHVPNARLFATHFVTFVQGLGDLEAYPNRDSLPYRDLYGIPEAETMYRGTLRNLGWCDVMQKLNELGYFGVDRRADLAGATFAQLMAGLVGIEVSEDLQARVGAALNVAPNSGVMMAFEWLGLLSDAQVSPQDTILDVLADQMLARMRYEPGEQDMVVLVHEIEAVYDDHHELITSTLIDFGEPGGETAMARTVGLPAASAVRLIMEGEIGLTGVQIPVVPDIYQPVLADLAAQGIAWTEQVQAVDG